MSDIVWEDPPLPPYGEHRRGTGRWQLFAGELQKHPGKWAVVTAGSLERGATGPLQQRLKRLGCEAVQRQQADGTFTLYARWPENA